MAVSRRSTSGKIKKCSCGRVILHIETKKSFDSSTKQPKPLKKEPKAIKRFKAIASFGKKSDSKGEKRFANSFRQDKVHASEGAIEHSDTAKPHECRDCCKRCKSRNDSAKNLSHHQSYAMQVSESTRTAVNQGLPPEITVVEDEQPVVYNPVPINTYEKFKEMTDLGFDGFSPSTTLKRAPSKFTFDGIVMSVSSMDSLLAVSVEEHKLPRAEEKTAILTDLAATELSKKKKNLVLPNGLSAIIPTLTDSDESALSDTKEEDKFFTQRADQTINMSERARTVSSDSEFSAIEFSEADYMKLCNGQIPHDNIRNEESNRGVIEITHTPSRSPEGAIDENSDRINMETTFSIELAANHFFREFSFFSIS